MSSTPAPDTCNFCGSHQTQVHVLFISPDKQAGICNVCVRQINVKFDQIELLMKMEGGTKQ